MKRSVIYIIIGIVCYSISLFTPLHEEKVFQPTATKKQSPKKEPKSESVPKPTPEPPEPKKKTIPKKITINNSQANKITLTQVDFDNLPGWDDADVKKSLTAFQSSCEAILKRNPKHQVGTQHLKIKAGDWHPACHAAIAIETVTEDNAREFFEKWFHPIKIDQKKPATGVFTGYYMPQVKGSLTKTGDYSTPIYGLPKNLRWEHPTRQQIDNGALGKKAPVIAWIKSPVDRLSMEIEGAGVVKLADGKKLYLSYAGENGAPYTSISSVLIKQGVMTKDNASKKAIKRYLDSHPTQAKSILAKNKSFVFFENMKEAKARGAQGMSLTPGYSLAVDKKWIPLGAPLWLKTSKPDIDTETDKKFQRLMIAQDTGGAIRGLVRGDIYWGAGKIATFLGEHMKNKGQYWLLLPKHIFNNLAKR